MIVEAIPLFVFIPVLAYLGYSDLKRNKVPNRITYPGVLLAIGLNIAFSGLSILYILGGGFAAFVFGFVLNQVVNIGGGDIKFITLIGFVFGYPWFLAPIAGGFAIGGMITLVRWLAGRRKDESPFGLYLSIGSVTVAGWIIFVIVGG